MTKFYNKSIMKERRKELRNKPTQEEIMLWKMLNKYLKIARFRRQYSIGFYILDFYSIRHRLCIELDGNDHLQKQEYDRERDGFLESRNILVLRFTNKQVRENLPEVMEQIRNHIFR